MLSIDPQKVCYIILKARAFDAKVEVVEPDSGSNSSDEAMGEVLQDYNDDATLDELKAIIDTLNEGRADRPGHAHLDRPRRFHGPGVGRGTP